MYIDSNKIWNIFLSFGLTLAAMGLFLPKTVGADTPAATVSAAPTDDATGGAVGDGSGVEADRVRISDNVGFYYFVSAGYVTQDDSKIPMLGKIAGDFSEKMQFSTPQKTYVELSNAIVRPGDFLVVYRVAGNINEDHAGFVGRRVENLAILQVIETQKTRCLAETKESFAPFKEGDLVKSYSDEILRWKQAQRRKELPSQPIHCYVAEGKPLLSNYSQNDWIVLTAGQKEGVVEGQTFRLRQKSETGFLAEDVHQPFGEARVFYTGPHYSMAQILTGSEPIQNGFEAWYQP
jgi:hypothetical protein